MALQDILDAIGSEIDKQIADARSAHQKQLSQIREESEQTLARKKQEITAQKERKKEQMRHKATSHAETLRRNAVLQKKRALLDNVYAAVTEELAKLPETKSERLLQACLARITTKGEIRPATAHAALLKRLASSEQFTVGEPIEAKGGFLFVSGKQEHDFRFETIVETIVRPRTELATSRSLFHTAA